jgi:hypothetical protein
VQTDIGRMQLNGNLVFERGLGDGPPRDTQLKYQWQVKYRWNQGLHVGLQGFGEPGKWNDWEPSRQQSHRAGPMTAGTLPIGGNQAFKTIKSVTRDIETGKERALQTAWLVYPVSGRPAAERGVELLARRRTHRLRLAGHLAGAHQRTRAVLAAHEA